MASLNNQNGVSVKSVLVTEKRNCFIQSTIGSDPPIGRLPCPRCPRYPPGIVWQYSPRTPCPMGSLQPPGINVINIIFKILNYKIYIWMTKKGERNTFSKCVGVKNKTDQFHQATVLQPYYISRHVSYFAAVSCLTAIFLKFRRQLCKPIKLKLKGWFNTKRNLPVINLKRNDFKTNYVSLHGRYILESDGGRRENGILFLFLVVKVWVRFRGFNLLICFDPWTL